MATFKSLMAAGLFQVLDETHQIVSMARGDILYVVKRYLIGRRVVFGCKEPGVVRNTQSIFFERAPDVR